MRLIKFSQDRCIPCQILGNFLESKGVKFEDKHVDELGVFGLNIMGAPVLLLAEEDGTPIDFVVGFNPSNPSEVNKLLAKMS